MQSENVKFNNHYKKYMIKCWPQFNHLQCPHTHPTGWHLAQVYQYPRLQPTLLVLHEYSQHTILGV